VEVQITIIYDREGGIRLIKTQKVDRFEWSDDIKHIMRERTWLARLDIPDGYTSSKEVLDYLQQNSDCTNRGCNSSCGGFNAFYAQLVNFEVVEKTTEFKVAMLKFSDTQCHLSKGGPQLTETDAYVTQRRLELNDKSMGFGVFLRY